MCFDKADKTFKVHITVTAKAKRKEEKNALCTTI